MDTSLLEWLNKYTFVEEQKFSDIDYAARVAELFLDELLKNGNHNGHDILYIT